MWMTALWPPSAVGLERLGGLVVVPAAALGEIAEGEPAAKRQGHRGAAAPAGLSPVQHAADSPDATVPPGFLTKEANQTGQPATRPTQAREVPGYPLMSITITAGLRCWIPSSFLSRAPDVGSWDPRGSSWRRCPWSCGAAPGRPRPGW